jgi:tetratricopeptide (TPR) repeat protein
MSDHKDALDLFIQALKASPEGTSPLSMLGNALLNLERNQEALEIMALASEQSGGDAATFRQLGKVHEALGDYEEAISVYKRARDIDRKDPETTIALGLAYRKLDRISEAINSFNAALSIQPDSEFALLQKGLCFVSQRDLENARAVYTTLQSLGHTDSSRKIEDLLPEIVSIPDAPIEREESNEDIAVTEENTEADSPSADDKVETLNKLKEFKERLKASPYDSNLYLQMGVLLQDTGRGKDAVHSFDLALRFDPNMHQASYQKALAQASLGNDEAAKTILLALTETGESGLVQKLSQRLGIDPASLVRKEQDTAQGSTEQDTTAPPIEETASKRDIAEPPPIPKDDAPAKRAIVEREHESLAAAAPKSTGKNGALDQYKDALRTNPFDSQVYLSMGITYHNLGQLHDALTAYHLAIRFEPKLTEAKYRKALVLIEQEKPQPAKEIYEEIKDLDEQELVKDLAKRLGFEERLVEEQPERLEEPVPIANAPGDAQIAPEVPASAPNETIASEEGLDILDPQSELEASKDEIKKNPYDAHAYIRLGRAYERLQRYTDAIKGFNLALQFDSTLAVAFYHRGLCHLGLGNEDAAREEYNLLQKGDHIDLARKLNDAFKESKNNRDNGTPKEPEKPKYGNPNDPDDIIESCKSVIKQDPYDPYAYHHMGVAYKTKEKYQDAINAFSLAIKAKSDFHEADYEKGLCYLKLGQEDKALQIYTALLKAGQKDIAKQLFDLFLTRLK